MSLVAIRAALELALDGIAPPIRTVWQRDPFDATVFPADEPYQLAHILWNRPANNENSASWTEIGLFQVTLCYPAPGDSVPTGQALLESRADLLRHTFRRTASFSALGATVTIDKTAELLPAYAHQGRDCLPVRCPFYAHISA